MQLLVPEKRVDHVVFSSGRMWLDNLLGTLEMLNQQFLCFNFLTFTNNVGYKWISIQIFFFEKEEQLLRIRMLTIDLFWRFSR